MKKPYKAKSLKGAERRVRELMRICDSWRQVAEQFNSERLMLAKLAAKGPTFFNPLDAMAAEKVRDEILDRLGINPDGTFKNKSA